MVRALRLWSYMGFLALLVGCKSQTPAGGADAGGRLSEFTQHDWQVSIDRWMKVRAGSSGVELPQRVTLTRGELRVRVFVERWKL